MKILIVEDDPRNIEAAHNQLREHDLTICSDFNDFEREIGGRYQDDGTLSQFDAAMIDVNLPLLTDRKSQENGPFGFSIALRCLGCIRLVGLISAANEGSHHSDSIQRSLDLFAFERQIQVIGDTVLIVVYLSGDRQDYECWKEVGDTGDYVKDYQMLLDALIEARSMLNE